MKVPKANFEWDSGKDLENQEKYGFSFSVAQFAFMDPNRVIAEDLSHSAGERRYFCFGQIQGGILTVRLPFAAEPSGFSEPGIGGRGKRFMKEKIKYTDEPLGDVKVIRDFLPPPEDLVLRDEGVKITISLSKRSIEFLKAKPRNTIRSISE